MSERQRTITQALRRRFGMSEKRQAELREFNAQQTDWYRQCRTCGKLLTGRIVDLKRPCNHGLDSQ